MNDQYASQAKTAMEVLQKQDHALNALSRYADAIQLSVLRMPIWKPLLITDLFSDPYSPDNYYFGWALHQAKHPDAKEFHKWDQRKKTRYRQSFEARAEANKRHPRYQLHREVLKLARVQQVANVLTK